MRWLKPPPVTPGVINRKLSICLPRAPMSEPRGRGSSFTTGVSTDAPSSGSEVSSEIGCAIISTLSVTLPGLRTASALEFLPTSTVTLRLTHTAKPAFSILTVYWPGIRSVTVKVPAELVVALLTTPFGVFVIVTLASGTTAPDWSVTVPLTPLRAWASRPEGEDRNKEQRARQARKTVVFGPGETRMKLCTKIKKDLILAPKLSESERIHKNHMGPAPLGRSLAKKREGVNASRCHPCIPRYVFGNKTTSASSSLGIRGKES